VEYRLWLMIALACRGCDLRDFCVLHSVSGRYCFSVYFVVHFVCFICCLSFCFHQNSSKSTGYRVICCKVKQIGLLLTYFFMMADSVTCIFHTITLVSPVNSYYVKNPCGLWGCKNRPAMFPGRMLYMTTKPGSVFPLLA